MPESGDAEVLHRITSGSRKKPAWRRWAPAVLAVLAVAGGGTWYATRKPKRVAPRFETVKIERADLVQTVTATGVLNPLDSVQVGGEVTGRVIKLGVDVNDRVTEGQLLAEIDPETLDARVSQSKASLASARASYASARATAKDAEAKVKRARDLQRRGLVSDQDLETAETTYAKAKAGMGTSAAQVTVAQADLTSAETQRRKAVLKAPIAGVVLARSVEVGQTITAGFQTPVLFTLARDLTRLQLQVSVNEADVSAVREGEHATFDVDAYPKREFSAEVVKLHNMPNSTTGVVTYLAVLSVDNQDLALRPGMTATASIIASERRGVLVVPNAALRFEPPARGSASASTSRAGAGLPIPGLGGGGPGGMGMGRGGGGRSRGSSAAAAAPSAGVAAAPREDAIYVLEGDRPKRVEVVTGATDGRRTEVSAPELSEGALVVIDQAEAPK